MQHTWREIKKIKIVCVKIIFHNQIALVSMISDDKADIHSIAIIINIYIYKNKRANVSHFTI